MSRTVFFFFFFFIEAVVFFLLTKSLFVSHKAKICNMLSNTLFWLAKASVFEDIGLKLRYIPPFPRKFYIVALTSQRYWLLIAAAVVYRYYL